MTSIADREIQALQDISAAAMAGRFNSIDEFNEALRGPSRWRDESVEPIANRETKNLGLEIGERRLAFRKQLDQRTNALVERCANWPTISLLTIAFIVVASAFTATNSPALSDAERDDLIETHKLNRMLDDVPNELEAQAKRVFDCLSSSGSAASCAGLNPQRLSAKSHSEFVTKAQRRLAYFSRREQQSAIACAKSAALCNSK